MSSEVKRRAWEAHPAPQGRASPGEPPPEAPPGDLSAGESAVDGPAPTHLALRLALSRSLCACSWVRSFSRSSVACSCSCSWACSSFCFSRAASALLSARCRLALSPRPTSWTARDVRTSSPPSCSRSLRKSRTGAGGWPPCTNQNCPVTLPVTVRVGKQSHLLSSVSEAVGKSACPYTTHKRASG